MQNTVEILRENVDIYQYPNTIYKDHNTGNMKLAVTIGDLHGNAIKLMFMLIKHGIAKMSPKNYEILVKIYQKDVNDLNKTDLENFNYILSEIEFDTYCLVRLIGDELADRGSNDYFTLKILDTLQKKNVPFEIILSNHSIEFIESWENPSDIEEMKFLPIDLDYNQGKSLFHLKKLINKKLVTEEEIYKILEESYNPNLLAISYSLHDDNKIFIYSHAGIGLETIKSLANKLSLECKDYTAGELATTIDAINYQFREYVKAKKTHTLYIRDRKDKKAFSDGNTDDPFEFIMWNRFYDELARPKNLANGKDKIYFVHGHDSSENNQDNIINLDNNLGKNLETNSGEYTVLFHQEMRKNNLEKQNNSPKSSTNRSRLSTEAEEIWYTEINARRFDFLNRIYNLNNTDQLIPDNIISQFKFENETQHNIDPDFYRHNLDLIIAAINLKIINNNIFRNFEKRKHKNYLYQNEIKPLYEYYQNFLYKDNEEIKSFYKSLLNEINSHFNSLMVSDELEKIDTLFKQTIQNSKPQTQEKIRELINNFELLKNDIQPYTEVTNHYNQKLKKIYDTFSINNDFNNIDQQNQTTIIASKPNENNPIPNNDPVDKSKTDINKEELLKKIQDRSPAPNKFDDNDKVDSPTTPLEKKVNDPCKTNLQSPENDDINVSEIKKVQDLVNFEWGNCCDFADLTSEEKEIIKRLNSDKKLNLSSIKLNLLLDEKFDLFKKIMINSIDQSLYKKFGAEKYKNSECQQAIREAKERCKKHLDRIIKAKDHAMYKLRELDIENTKYKLQLTLLGISETDLNLRYPLIFNEVIPEDINNQINPNAQLIAQLNDLIEKIRTIKVPNCKDVENASETLAQALGAALKEWQTKDDVSAHQFKTACDTAINNAMTTFNQHRGFHKTFSPIIRKILGIIAAITVIPGLIVACASKNGFKYTFFESNPKTNSAKKLDAIQNNIERLLIN